ncbi:2-amino-4-hydroxy-6-hydroxymethyldihydropteridine diphosphokinase [Candidatus Aerophobetes bacterium]|uniref:2-amino-4-hydroxy-6-hydroxymethyldihydropteridine diphosphokinase n=1 Tax=Aerophobetes bacterium TaxID=2030807 RepID=A0A523UWF0_UNCAE|nr:MAG: 2-amino-4-hydroxy-6-hydroxymethyldihydropteridine diphosphokinase [Candidatus Aerophobetes bacterium]
MPRVYIGLGSNRGDRLKNLKDSLSHIKREIEIRRVSSLYLTEPVGMEGSWFLNCVLEGETELDPNELMETLLAIEKEMGRVRKKKKEERIIDLDLLLYQGRVLKEKGLILPHPRLHKRRFVLVPLVEINPHLYHPVLKRTVKEILNGLKDSYRIDKLSRDS